MNIEMDASSEMVILCNKLVRPSARLQNPRSITPKHRCEVDKKLLVTRRALDNITWPDVLTNRCCGPAAGRTVD